MKALSALKQGVLIIVLSTFIMALTVVGNSSFVSREWGLFVPLEAGLFTSFLGTVIGFIRIFVFNKNPTKTQQKSNRKRFVITALIYSNL